LGGGEVVGKGCRDITNSLIGERKKNPAKKSIDHKGIPARRAGPGPTEGEGGWERGEIINYLLARGGILIHFCRVQKGSYVGWGETVLFSTAGKTTLRNRRPGYFQKQKALGGIKYRSGGERSPAYSVRPTRQKKGGEKRKAIQWKPGGRGPKRKALNSTRSSNRRGRPRT